MIDEDSQDIFDEDFSRYGFNNGESPKKPKGLDSESNENFLRPLFVLKIYMVIADWSAVKLLSALNLQNTKLVF